MRACALAAWHTLVSPQVAGHPRSVQARSPQGPQQRSVRVRAPEPPGHPPPLCQVPHLRAQHIPRNTTTMSSLQSSTMSHSVASFTTAGHSPPVMQGTRVVRELYSAVQHHAGCCISWFSTGHSQPHVHIPGPNHTVPDPANPLPGSSMMLGAERGLRGGPCDDMPGAAEPRTRELSEAVARGRLPPPSPRPPFTPSPFLCRRARAAPHSSSLSSTYAPASSSDSDEEDDPS